MLSRQRASATSQEGSAALSATAAAGDDSTLPALQPHKPLFSSGAATTGATLSAHASAARRADGWRAAPPVRPSSDWSRPLAALERQRETARVAYMPYTMVVAEMEAARHAEERLRALGSHGGDTYARDGVYRQTLLDVRSRPQTGQARDDDINNDDAVLRLPSLRQAQESMVRAGEVPRLPPSAQQSALVPTHGAEVASTAVRTPTLPAQPARASGLALSPGGRTAGGHDWPTPAFATSSAFPDALQSTHRYRESSADVSMAEDYAKLTRLLQGFGAGNAEPAADAASGAAGASLPVSGEVSVSAAVDRDSSGALSARLPPPAAAAPRGSRQVSDASATTATASDAFRLFLAQHRPSAARATPLTRGDLTRFHRHLNRYLTRQLRDLQRYEEGERAQLHGDAMRALQTLRGMHRAYLDYVELRQRQAAAAAAAVAVAEAQAEALRALYREPAPEPLRAFECEAEQPPEPLATLWDFSASRAVDVSPTAADAAAAVPEVFEELEMWAGLSGRPLTAALEPFEDLETTAAEATAEEATTMVMMAQEVFEELRPRLDFDELKAGSTVSLHMPPPLEPFEELMCSAGAGVDAAGLQEAFEGLVPRADDVPATPDVEAPCVAAPPAPELFEELVMGSVHDVVLPPRPAPFVVLEVSAEDHNESDGSCGSDAAVLQEAFEELVLPPEPNTPPPQAASEPVPVEQLLPAPSAEPFEELREAEDVCVSAVLPLPPLEPFQLLEPRSGSEAGLKDGNESFEDLCSSTGFLELEMSAGMLATLQAAPPSSGFQELTVSTQMGGVAAGQVEVYEELLVMAGCAREGNAVEHSLPVVPSAVRAATPSLPSTPRSEGGFEELVHRSSASTPDSSAAAAAGWAERFEELLGVSTASGDGEAAVGSTHLKEEFEELSVVRGFEELCDHPGLNGGPQQQSSQTQSNRFEELAARGVTPAEVAGLQEAFEGRVAVKTPAQPSREQSCTGEEGDAESAAASSNSDSFAEPQESVTAQPAAVPGPLTVLEEVAVKSSVSRSVQAVLVDLREECEELCVTPVAEVAHSVERETSTSSSHSRSDTHRLDSADPGPVSEPETRADTEADTVAEPSLRCSDGGYRVGVPHSLRSANDALQLVTCDFHDLTLDGFAATDLGDVFAQACGVRRPLLIACERTLDGDDWCAVLLASAAVVRDCIVADVCAALECAPIRIRNLTLVAATGSDVAEAAAAATAVVAEEGSETAASTVTLLTPRIEEGVRDAGLRIRFDLVHESAFSVSPEAEVHYLLNECSFPFLTQWTRSRAALASVGAPRPPPDAQALLSAQASVAMGAGGVALPLWAYATEAARRVRRKNHTPIPVSRFSFSKGFETVATSLSGSAGGARRSHTASSTSSVGEVHPLSASSRAPPPPPLVNILMKHRSDLSIRQSFSSDVSVTVIDSANARSSESLFSSPSQPKRKGFSSWKRKE